MSLSSIEELALESIKTVKTQNILTTIPHLVECKQHHFQGLRGAAFHLTQHLAHLVIVALAMLLKSIVVEPGQFDLHTHQLIYKICISKTCGRSSRITIYQHYQQDPLENEPSLRSSVLKGSTQLTSLLFSISPAATKTNCT